MLIAPRFAALLLVLALGSPLDAANLITNGDFAAGRDGWAVYPHRQGAGDAAVVDDGDGGQLLRITKNKPLPGPPGAHQIVALTQPNRAHELRYRVRAIDVRYADSSVMRPVVQVFFRNTDTGETVRIVTEPLPVEPVEWQTVSLRFTPPANADQMQVTVMSHGMTGTVELDDFELTALPSHLGAWPASRREGRWMNDIARDIATPHTPWARPLPGGPLKVAMLLNRVGAREAMELAQRLDMDFEAVLAYHPTALGLPDENAEFIGTSITEKRVALEAMLEKQHDLFIIGCVQWTALPPEAAEAILAKVRDGMGLVIVFEQDELAPSGEPVAAPRIVEGIPADALRFGYVYGWSAAKNSETAPGPDEPLHTFTLGRGRIAHLRYTYPDQLKWQGIEKSYGPYGGSALTPWVMYDGSNLHRYEYHMMMLARTCLWAAQRSAEADPKVAPMAVPAGRAASLSLLGARGVMHYALRDDRFGVTMTSGQIEGGAIELPALPAGTYRLTYRLLDDAGRVIAFGAPRLDVAPRGRIENTRRVLTDRFGRILMDESQPLTPLHRLDVIGVDENGAPLAIERSEVMLPGAPRDDYLLGPYTSMSSYYIMHLMHQRVADHFANNAQYEIGRWRNQFRAPLLSAARVGMEHVAGSQTLYKARPWQAKYRKRHLDLVERDAKQLAEAGVEPTGVAMGDESTVYWGYTDEFNDDAEFVAALRDWTQKQYQTLDSLNATWGTRFVDWSDVTPIALVDARKTGQYARWFDGWQCVNDSFTTLLRDSAAAIHQHLPDTPVGFEDPIDIGVATGYDVPAMFQPVTFYGAYQRYGHWLTMRSFAKPGAVMLSVSHARTPDPQGRQGRWQLWSSLFHGFQGHLYHRLEGSYDYAAMGYDLSLRHKWLTNDPISTQDEADAVAHYPVELKSFGEVTKQLNDGYARLVLSAVREAEPVAIYHNTPSVYAAFLVATVNDDDPTLSKRYSENLDAPFIMEHLLNDAHVTYRMVSDGEIDNGLQAKVLVLPRVLAMSKQTAERIAAFVRDGGTLVAGVRPAVFDEHCNPQASGLLDAVFGVKSAMPQVAELQTDAATIDGVGSLPHVEYDPNVALAGGTARGLTQRDRVPLMIENKYDNGRAILWNILPRYHVDGRNIRDMVDSWGRMLDAAFGNAPVPEMGHPALLDSLRRATRDVPHPVTFTGQSADLRAVELWSFTHGKTNLIGLSRRNYPLDTDVDHVNLAIDGERHVYDVIRGEYLGRTNTFTVPLEWGDAGLIATLPTKAAAPRVAAEGDALRIVIDHDTVLRLRVFDPAGDERPEHHRNLVAHGGEAQTYRVPRAANDAAGTWRIELTDVISGLLTFAELNRP